MKIRPGIGPRAEVNVPAADKPSQIKIMVSRPRFRFISRDAF